MSKYKVNPPNKVISTPLNRGTIGIFFSYKYTIIKEIRVAITNGGIAILRLWSFLKYIIKKTNSGPKSVKNLIPGLPI